MTITVSTAQQRKWVDRHISCALLSTICLQTHRYYAASCNILFPVYFAVSFYIHVSRSSGSASLSCGGQVCSAACSLLIYGLPSYATRDEDLREFLQSMFPQTTVLAAHLVMRMDKLVSLKSDTRLS